MGDNEELSVDQETVDQKVDALRYMTESAEAGTGVIIRSRNRGRIS